MNVVVTILAYNIFPIFLIVCIGLIIGKKFHVSVEHLSKLNFYVFVPAFMFGNLYATQLDMSMIKVLVASVLMLLFSNAAAYLLGRTLQFDEGKMSTLQNSFMFLNSGNIGVPLVTLVFSNAPFLINGETIYLETALSVQIIFLMIQNIGVNSIGFYKAGRGKMDKKATLGKIRGLPTIYVIPLALVLKFLPYDMTLLPGWAALMYLKDGLVPIALLSLGLQLSSTKISLKDKDVNITVCLKSLLTPLIAIFLNYILGLEGLTAQTFFICSIVPTGVNVALMAVECDNNKEYAAQVVVFTTILSIVTMPVYLVISRLLYPI